MTSPVKVTPTQEQQMDALHIAHRTTGLLVEKRGEIIAEALAQAVAAERERCNGIVGLARNAEIDRDLRTVMHFIQGGRSVEEIRNLSK